MHISSTPLLLTVTRSKPELVAPAKPTPRGLQPLSDLDDQESLRFHIPLMYVYPGGQRKEDVRDPVRVIREALAEALVYYYPLAGRLREGSGRKLVVDCTGEGVVFVEADADFTLEDLSRDQGGCLRSPFPSELLYDVPGSSGILNCPLFLIQVTRFICGGFSFAVRFIHTMVDGTGLVQFLNAVAELARGTSQPSVTPVWGRGLLVARDPPRVTCTHREYSQIDGTIFPIQYMEDKVIERSFFFGSSELSTIRHCLQPHLKRCSTFELLSAFLWRCRTIALRFDPLEEVRYLCLINVRPRLKPPPPTGYYGNTFVFPAAVSTAGELSSNNLDYAVELIKKAKAEATDEYVQSVMDLMATHGRPHLTVPGSWLVSDNTRIGHLEVDFGWGKPVYGGPTSAMVGAIPGPIGFFVKGTNNEGESGVFALVCLPETAMERFAREFESVAKGRNRSSIDVCSKL